METNLKLPFDLSPEYARSADASDELRGFRERFYFPLFHGKDVLYFAGNSLGLQPKTLQDYVVNELEDWATYGVEGHFHSRNPWFSYQEILTGQVAALLGAKPVEVVTMNSLTVNLHLLLVSFYRPTKSRYKIMCEFDAFPSDIYAIQSQVKFHGHQPQDAMIELKAKPGEYCLRTEDILRAIEENRDTLSTVMLGAVNYFTGQFFDLEKITKAAHNVGATVGFNLAHAAGNVLLNLHDWNVDYACFCSYKYLNSGPGGVSGIFVHEKHAANDSLPRFAGWWGNDPETRFKMPRNFIPAEGANGWQLSNAPVLAMAALKSSLDIFEEAGMERLRKKSEQLTGYLEFRIRELNTKWKSKMKSGPVQIITPSDPARRGCQLSLVFPEDGRTVFRYLSENGIVVDWREPNVIRVTPVPLYNSFEDVFQFAESLDKFWSQNKS